MKKTITLCMMIILSVAQINAQTFKWAIQAGGIDHDTGEETAFDASGNVYMVGIFNLTADLDPGAGVYNVTSAGAQDVYVVKLDSNGSFVWGATVGGSHQDFGYSIAVNGASVYVCGRFRDTADFDPGVNVSNLISAGGSDIFVLKLDTSSQFAWVKQVGGTGDDMAEKFTLDNAGNILVCGQFQNTADFDPNAGVQNMTSAGSADAYVLKLDANGNYIWAGQFGNAPGQFAFCIATDASDDIYVTGQFYGTTDFDPGAGIYNMSTTGFNANIYVLKWSSAGNFIWAVNMGNSSGGDGGYMIRTDYAGNPVVTGTYFGTVDFDPGPNTYNLTAAGNNGDFFVLKLTSANGDFMFAKGMGGNGLDQSYGLALSPSGNIYVTGFFSLTADFDPDTAVTYNLVAWGPGDIFILELDTAGNFASVNAIGGSDNDYGRGISFYNGNVYTCGVFSWTADFAPGNPVYNISSFSNSSDAFLTKLFFCTPFQTSIPYSLCPGDSVFAGGAYQVNPGLYQDFYLSVGGCDSIVSTVVQYTFVLNQLHDASACDGQQVLLDAGMPGASYQWSTGESTQTIIVTATNNYSVEVTYNGCVQSDSAYITFTPLPSVNLGNDTTICINHSLIFDAGSGFSSYIWSNGSTGQTLTLDGSSGIGVYTITVMVTDSAGCENSDTVYVTVSSCAGIAESVAHQLISVSPVPAGDFIVIESAEKITEVSIFNAAGSKVLQLRDAFAVNRHTVSTQSLDNGIYYVQVKTSRGIHSARMVVLHQY